MLTTSEIDVAVKRRCLQADCKLIRSLVSTNVEAVRTDTCDAPSLGPRIETYRQSPRATRARLGAVALLWVLPGPFGGGISWIVGGPTVAKWLLAGVYVFVLLVSAWLLHGAYHFRNTTLALHRSGLRYQDGSGELQCPYDTITALQFSLSQETTNFGAGRVFHLDEVHLSSAISQPRVLHLETEDNLPALRALCACSAHLVERAWNDHVAGRLVEFGDLRVHPEGIAYQQPTPPDRKASAYPEVRIPWSSIRGIELRVARSEEEVAPVTLLGNFSPIEFPLARLRNPHALFALFARRGLAAHFPLA